MAANQILNMIDVLAESRNKFVSKQQMFTEKIANEQNKQDVEYTVSYEKAYADKYGKLNQKDSDDNTKQIHQLVPYLDETYDYIKKVSESINSSIDLVNFIDDMIKQNFVISNSKIEFYKEEYDKANSKYKSKIDVNSATKILKMDTYDRNIEENFFIMYYLISYGVIGYFMYKLLKIQ